MNGGASPLLEPSIVTNDRERRAPPPRPSPSRGEGERAARSPRIDRLFAARSVSARRRIPDAARHTDDLLPSDRRRLLVPSPLEGEGQGGGAGPLVPTDGPAEAMAGTGPVGPAVASAPPTRGAHP